MRVILGFDSHEVDGLLNRFVESARADGARATVIHFDDDKKTEDTPKDPPEASPEAAAVPVPIAEAAAVKVAAAEAAIVKVAAAEAAAVTASSSESDVEELDIKLTEDGVRKLYEEIFDDSITMQVIFSATFDEICYLRLSDGEYMSPVVTAVIKPKIEKLIAGTVIEVLQTRLDTNSHRKKYSENGSFLRDQLLLHLVITDYHVVAEKRQVQRLLGPLDTSLTYKAALAHVAPILKKRNPNFRFTERNLLRDKVKAQKMFKQGTMYLGVKKLEKAIDSFEEAKSAYPYDHRFWYNCSRCFYDLGLYERSEEEAVGSLKMSPFEMKVYAGAGHAAMKQKNYEQSLEYSFSGHFMCGAADDYFHLMCEVQKKIAEATGEKENDYKAAVVDRFIRDIYGHRLPREANQTESSETNSKRKAAYREERQKEENKEEQYTDEMDGAEGDDGDQKKNMKEKQGEMLEMNKRSKNLYHETLRDARRLYETKAFRQALEKFGKALAYASPNGDSTAISGYSDRQEIQEIQFLVAACKIRSDVEALEGMNTMKFFSGDNTAINARASAHYFLGRGYKRMCLGKHIIRESSECSSALNDQKQKSFNWPESNDVFPESDPERLKILNDELYNGGEYHFEKAKCLKSWIYLPVDLRVPSAIGETLDFDALNEYMENLVKNSVDGLRQQGNLIGRPSDIKPVPRATCKFANCISGKEKIYETNPDFTGFVDILCEELCIFTYHPSCWEALKRTEEYAGNNSDTDFLDSKCLDPDCTGKINAILIHDETGTLRQEIKANTAGKQNSATGTKQKKKKKKKKSKQTKSQEVKDTEDSKCEDESEDLAHNEETVANSWDADDTESQCSNDHQNNTEEKAQVPVSPLPIDPASLEKVSDDNLALKNPSKKKKTKKQKEVIELDLGSPLDTDDSNNEYAARLRKLKQQKEANESGNIFPQVRPLDRAHLLDPENPFYMPQHLRDNPKELEKVLQTKKNASLSSSGNNTNTSLLNDGKKGKKPSHLLDDAKGSSSSSSVTSPHVESEVSSRSSQNTTNPTNSPVKKRRGKSVGVDSDSYSAKTKNRDIVSNDDSHLGSLPKDLLEQMRAKNNAAMKRFLTQRMSGSSEPEVTCPSSVESTPENVHESQSLIHLKDENKREEGSEDTTARDLEDYHKVNTFIQALQALKDVGDKTEDIAVSSQNCDDDTQDIEESRQKTVIEKATDGSVDTIAINSQSADDDTHKVGEPELKSVVQKAVDGGVDATVLNSQSGEDRSKNVEEPEQESDVQKDVDGSPKTIASTSQSGDNNTREVEEPALKSVGEKESDEGNGRGLPSTADILLARLTPSPQVSGSSLSSCTQDLSQSDVDGSPSTIASTSQSGDDNSQEVEEPVLKSVGQKAVDGNPNTNAISSQSGHDDDYQVEKPKQKLAGQKAVASVNSQRGDDDTHQVEVPRQESVVQKAIDDGPNNLAINSQGQEVKTAKGQNKHNSQRQEVKTAKRQNKQETHKDSPLQPHKSQNEQHSKEEGLEDKEIKEISEAEEESKETILTELGIVKDSMGKLTEENQKLKDEMIQIKAEKDLEIRSLQQNIEGEKAEKRELQSEKQSLTVEMERQVRKCKGEISEMQEEIKAFQNHRVSLEHKYESSLRRIEGLEVKLIKEQEHSTMLSDEVHCLKESISTSYRRALEAEVKYLRVKRDLAESFLNRTIDRLTSEVVHLENLLQYASEDSVPDLATISRTIEEWDAHIRTLQDQSSLFLEEANLLINLVTQGEPLNTLPQQDIVIPDIPNVNIVPLFTVAPNPKKQLVQPSALESQAEPVTLTGSSAYGGGAIPKGSIVSNPKPVVMTAGAGAATAYNYPDSHKLFVGKIPRECTGLDIKRAFSDLFGEVVGVILYDKGVTPKGKPIPKYGFVTFYNVEDQEKALNYGPLMIGNCELNIQAKKPKYPITTSNLGVEGFSSDGNRYGGNKSVECIPMISSKTNSTPPLVSGNPAGIIGTSPSKQVWSQLGKPANSKGVAQSVAVTTSTSGNDEIEAYKRLIGVCKQHMGKEYSSPEICSALREVRMKNGSNFSEMSVDHIVESVKQQLRARKLATE